MALADVKHIRLTARQVKLFEVGGQVNFLGNAARSPRLKPLRVLIQ